MTNEAANTSTALAIGENRAIVASTPPAAWNAFLSLPCHISLQIPVPGFTVAALLRLGAGEVINTHWLQGADVPMQVNGKVVGWTEFEVVDGQLAARITQIA
jgi:flagellar motor switch/type III secretory pathway protein FliN